MAAVKSKNTSFEVALGKALWSEGLRYRKNNKTVFGKPDFTFKKHKVAVFVDSEFFHGKDFDTKKKPATNAEFWEKKIKGNMQRDIDVNERLKAEGWTVLRFWSQEIKKNLEECVAVIKKVIEEKSGTAK